MESQKFDDNIHCQTEKNVFFMRNSIPFWNSCNGKFVALFIRFQLFSMLFFTRSIGTVLNRDVTSNEIIMLPEGIFIFEITSLKMKKSVTCNFGDGNDSLRMLAKVLYCKWQCLLVRLQDVEENSLCEF